MCKSGSDIVRKNLQGMQKEDWMEGLHGHPAHAGLSSLRLYATRKYRGTRIVHMQINLHPDGLSQHGYHHDKERGSPYFGSLIFNLGSSRSLRCRLPDATGCSWMREYNMRSGDGIFFNAAWNKTYLHSVPTCQRSTGKHVSLCGPRVSVVFFLGQAALPPRLSQALKFADEDDTETGSPRLPTDSLSIPRDDVKHLDNISSILSGTKDLSNGHYMSRPWGRLLQESDNAFVHADKRCSSSCSALDESGSGLVHADRRSSICRRALDESCSGFSASMARPLKVRSMSRSASLPSRATACAQPGGKLLAAVSGLDDLNSHLRAKLSQIKK